MCVTGKEAGSEGCSRLDRAHSEGRSFELGKAAGILPSIQSRAWKSLTLPWTQASPSHP